LAAATAVVAVGLFAIPIPLHTNAEGVIWLPEDAYVRAGTDGFVERLLAVSGQRVDKGAMLIESRDDFLAAEIELHRQRIQELEVRLTAERFAERALAEITRMELAEQQSRQASSLEKRDRLIARSERTGTFVVPQPLDLPGRFFRKGETIGYVLPDATSTIRGIILQDDIDLVRHQLKGAEVKLAMALAEATPARIVREVPAAGDEVPSKALTASGGGAIASDPKDPAGMKVARRVFQFDLELAAPLPRPVFGGRAYVRFEHRPEPLGHQVYRRLRQLFLSRFNA
jgi:putative peptide zinc metalloprotease protein